MYLKTRLILYSWYCINTSITCFIFLFFISTWYRSTGIFEIPSSDDLTNPCFPSGSFFFFINTNQYNCRHWFRVSVCSWVKSARGFLMHIKGPRMLSLKNMARYRKAHVYTHPYVFVSPHVFSGGCAFMFSCTYCTEFLWSLSTYRFLWAECCWRAQMTLSCRQI